VTVSVRTATRTRARLSALGAYAPDRVVTNAEIETWVDTSDEWIRTRTGIRERRWAEAGELASDLAVRAARRILDDAAVDPAEIDMVIVPTATPDHAFPSTAALVAHRIGARDAAAYDLSAACSGFVYGLAQAAGLVEGGIARTVLVVGAEVLSRITDPTDRGTCILFADGAGGALVTAGDPEATTGFLGWDIGADAAGAADLAVPRGGCITMNGPEVFRFATRVMVESTERLLDAVGVGMDAIDLVVAHQANSRILDHAAERLGIPSDRLFTNIDRYGNTSSASVPLALAEARDTRRLGPGDLLLLVAFGGGLTWASTIVRYEPAEAA
jgi:3-oxoacyl-[acyl-carrier-protein] synthase-3